LLIEWYVFLFGDFNHCEAIPQAFQAQFVNPGKMQHKVADSTLMVSVGLLGQYQTAILVGLNQSVQLWFECGCKDLVLIAPSVNPISCVGKKMVDISREQEAKEAGKGDLSDDDIIHIGFWSIIFVILVSIISF
jgi:hypothetical protein